MCICIGEADTGSATKTESEDLLTRFKFLRIIRCLRLIKLMRLMRASRMMARWETRVAINYGYLQLGKVHTHACA